MPRQAESVGEAKDKRAKADALYPSPNQPAAGLGFGLWNYLLILHRVQAQEKEGKGEFNLKFS
jgi:hypothetical protein